MQLKRIHSSPDIYHLMMPFRNLNLNATNCYIICEGQEALIVDTGAPTKEAKSILIDALRELDIDRVNVRLFLTHFHLDHAGLTGQIVSPEQILYVGEREYLRTRGEENLRNAAAVHQNFLDVGAAEEEANTAQELRIAEGSYVGEDHMFSFVNEGDTIRVGSYNFEVIDTAGHTPGHISLFEPQSGILFSGDHILFIISPSIDYFPNYEDGFARYIGNLEKTKKLPVKMLLHSHGAIMCDHKERIDWLIRHQEERLDEVTDIIKRTPNKQGIDIIKQIKWNVPADSWEGIPLLQRALIVAQGMTLLEHLAQKNMITCSVDGKGIQCYQII